MSSQVQIHASFYCRALAWHRQTRDSFHTCICFAYGSAIKTILNTVCRINTFLANYSHVSHLGRALGNSRLVVVLPTSNALFL